MTRSGKRVFSVVLFAMALLLLSWSIRRYHLDLYAGDIYTETFGNKLERSLKKVASRDALNCGTVRVAADATTTSDCAPAADAIGHPFLAMYAVDSEEGLTYRGVVRLPDGSYREYRWRPANAEEANAIFSGPDPELVPCADPHSLHRTWQGVPTCTNDR